MSELEKQFAAVVPLIDINNSLQIAIDGQETSFAPDAEIELTLYNKSYHFLYFENGSRVKLLVSTDNLHWLEVKNAFTDSLPMKLSPKGTILLDTRHILVQPILDQSIFNVKGEEFRLRIVLIGEIMNGDTRTGKEVGAYTDVSLKP